MTKMAPLEELQKHLSRIEAARLVCPAQMKCYITHIVYHYHITQVRGQCRKNSARMYHQVSLMSPKLHDLFLR